MTDPSEPSSSAVRARPRVAGPSLGDRRRARLVARALAASVLAALWLEGTPAEAEPLASTSSVAAGTEAEPLASTSSVAPGAESDASSGVDDLIEELTYEQRAGLPPAASKIFFSKRNWSISGFGEIAHNEYLGEANRTLGDIELYNSNLYRFVLYGAYKPVDWLILYAEVFAEVFQDRQREFEIEVLPEISPNSS